MLEMKLLIFAGDILFIIIKPLYDKISLIFVKCFLFGFFSLDVEICVDFDLSYSKSSPIDLFFIFCLYLSAAAAFVSNGKIMQLIVIFLIAFIEFIEPFKVSE